MTKKMPKSSATLKVPEEAISPQKEYSFEMSPESPVKK